MIESSSLEYFYFVTVSCVYAPTLTNSEESILAFYQNFKITITKLLKANKILLLADFNARVGKDHSTWKTLGKMNSHGLRLLQLCTEFQLVICNSFCHKKIDSKITWIHPRSKHRYIHDPIICCKPDLQDLCPTHVCCCMWHGL